jgi:phenylacetic acid degradation operon negative regulatory protein
MQEIRNTALLARPLSARSVIASLLLGMHPPQMRAARLVQWCELFGIAPGTARVALSRMTERGELVAVDGAYELAGRVRARQTAQEWSLAARAPARRWQGDWRFGVVMGEARSAAARAALREAMRGCRYAELREGCWTRPANLPRESAPEDAWAVADEQCSWWTARADDAGAVGELVASLFAPATWAARARELSSRLHDDVDALGRGDHERLAGAFVAGAAALQHVRNDPLLPAALLPPDWPGDELRAQYRTYQKVFGDAARAWFRTVDGVAHASNVP